MLCSVLCALLGLPLCAGRTWGQDCAVERTRQVWGLNLLLLPGLVTLGKVIILPEPRFPCLLEENDMLHRVEYLFPRAVVTNYRKLA